MPSRSIDQFAAFLRRTRARTLGMNLPEIPEVDIALEAARRAGLEVVGLDARPDVVVTADGVLEAGCVRLLKEEVDELVPDAKVVVVVRHLGPIGLAPTLDAYLDVSMTSSRDHWLHEVCVGVLPSHKH